jgi:hypothetical protein
LELKYVACGIRRREFDVAELLVQFAEPGKPAFAVGSEHPSVIWTKAEKCVEPETGRLTQACLDLIKTGQAKKFQVVLVGSPSTLGSIRGAARLPVALIPKPNDKMSIADISDWLRARLSPTLRSRARSGEVRAREPRSKEINPQYLTPVLSFEQRKAFFAAVQNAESEDAGLSSHRRVFDIPGTTLEEEPSVPRIAMHLVKSAKAGA